MEKLSHVVLGGNGVTGSETIKALRERGVDPLSVGRCGPSDGRARSLAADLLERAQAGRALDGADVAYFTVGLPYSLRTWREQWPIILGNVIDAAVEHGTRLIYLDNVYAYGEVDGPMTESTPIRPTSGKGEVRADAVRMLEAAGERGLTYAIARSSDFYGHGATMSVFNRFAIEPAAKGKTGSWMFNADVPHSLTYTPDIGKALAILGTDPRGKTGTWHIPTAPVLTGREYVEILEGPGSRAKGISECFMRFGGVFASAARETLEMAYQYTGPHILDSSLFEETFGMQPTPIAEGIEATLDSMRGK